ncbi:hypothetical protein M7I_2796 [Glarea lozoyensis 74030]|uniref:Uncharacterized protein n=1 Tax=Glarea lozoyensis (strain ATCC 74030 / MF5533) TaxID=1104152 RepID=H0EJR6_GLAL7|nr:hypothetical protein M7I_2796 [Glarea lozoyensis 74030]
MVIISHIYVHSLIFRRAPKATQALQRKSKIIVILRWLQQAKDFNR